MGDLVWERILRKCQYEDNGAFVRALPRVFTAEDVREEAKYTCRNWFLKIAGNRSLVGRIYLEASISRCHHFLIEPGPLPPRGLLICRFCHLQLW